MESLRMENPEIGTEMEPKWNQNGIVTVITATLIVAFKLDHLQQIKLILFIRFDALQLV